MAPKTPRALIEQWRHENWPPKGMTPISEDPTVPRERISLYYGNYDQVAAFCQTIADDMPGVADHIVDKCDNRRPRWMRIPTAIFDVVRVNVAHAEGKVSRSFRTTKDLVAVCGVFTNESVVRMEEWLQSAPEAVLVAHRPIIDQRAYVYRKGDDKPLRERFLYAGLVLAVSPGYALEIQDRRTMTRDKRSDVHTNVLATTDRWTVFGGVKKKKKKTELTP